MGRSCSRQRTLVAPRELARYPHSRQLPMLSDTGASNGYRCRASETRLQRQLADSHGLQRGDHGIDLMARTTWYAGR
jgi:hypothetical protein